MSTRYAKEDAKEDDAQYKAMKFVAATYINQ
jgi:hypothetical protein